MSDLQYADAVELDFAPREDPPLPDHLIRARPDGLAYWRCVGLRAAGFPIADALRLGAPEAAGTADALIAAERRAEEASAALLAAINAALDALRDEGRWDQAELRNPLMDARSKVKAGKLPNGELPPPIAARVAEARSAREAVAPARAEYEQGHAAALRRTSAVLREIAASDRLREAITWQNRQALHTALDPLLNAPEDARGSKHRQHEALLASYVQRYCVKNDTIGFFGPVGWAEFVDEGAPMVSRPGPGLVATRRTYFEMWGIEALAAWISGEESFRPWLKPLPNPAVRVEGTTLHHPVFGSLPIPVSDAVALSMCDGNRTARDVAKVLLRLPRSPFKTEGDVYRHLLDLEHRGLLRYSIYVPYDAFPERALRGWLEGIGDEAPRREGLARLDALEAARREVSAATGNWRELGPALSRLDETFTEMTGVAPTRSAGGMYAARTLVYEDCRRDGEVKMGPELLRALDEPLSLMMRSARWLTAECAEICMAAVRQIYEDLVQAHGSPVVDAARFWIHLTDTFTARGETVFEPALEELKRRWDLLLPSEPGQRRVFASAEELRARVEAAFPAAAPGWRMARYHSPDVMIAAAGPEAIARGEFQLVMGECHLSANTLAVSLFVNQHPSPRSLVDATRWDLGGEHIVPVEPKNFGDFTARTARALVSPRAHRLEWSRDSLATRDSRSLRVSTLVVQDVDGELVVRSRDGAHEFPLMELVSEPLSGIFTHSFGVLTEGRYVPRRTIDRLVVSRETWRFAPAELGFAFEKKEADRFLGLQRWARAHGLPRYVFTKVPVERKPCFIDLHSAIYAEAFAKLVRRSAEQGEPDDLVTVSEMLPGPDELWLADAEGRPHVSELRIVLVDLGDRDEPTDAAEA
ncbi:MAG TPA: lantibiotic dehydratase [Longimicrobium sp.]|nr:lantibiotic dehydratase [Longimicrobium sp.]